MNAAGSMAGTRCEYVRPPAHELLIESKIAKQAAADVAMTGVTRQPLHNVHAPERREFDRVCFPAEHGRRIQLRLRLDDAPAAMGDIVDLSRHGVGLRIAAPVDAGSRAVVALRLGDRTLTVSGVVRWCEPVNSERRRPNGPNAYHVGIAFDPAATKNNILFFVTLSRFCVLID